MISKLYKNNRRPFWILNRRADNARLIINNKIQTGEWQLIKRTCPLCTQNDQNFDVLSEKNKYGIEQLVIICKSCGLIFYGNGLDENSTHDFYKNFYVDLCTGGANTEEIFSYQKHRGSEVFEFLKNKISEPKIVLEIGCGTAGISYTLKQYYQETQFYGLDYRSDDIDFAQKYGIKIFEYSPDIYKKLAEIKFDLIIAYHVVEHFLDLTDELEKIKSIMHDNTVLFLGVPGVFKTYYYYNYFLESISLDHNYYFSADTLNNIMSVLGFEKIYIDENVNALYKLSTGYEKSEFKNVYNGIMNYILKYEPKTTFLYLMKLKYAQFKLFLKDIIKKWCK